MHIPVESPLTLCAFLLVFFYLIGRLTQTLTIRKCHPSIHTYFFDCSVSFILAGTSLQYTFISFFYGSFYAQVLSALEFLVLPEFLLGGSGNPLDNVVVSTWRDWLTYLRIPFQMFGSFSAMLLSRCFWSFTYGRFEKTIFTTNKEEDSMVMIDNFICMAPLSISSHDGFLSEFLGSMVRLVVSKWSTCRNKWANKLVALCCRIGLKMQGSYTAKYVVNPLIMLNYTVFCPGRINGVFFSVYCIAPTLGAILASILHILPDGRAVMKERVEVESKKERDFLLLEKYHRRLNAKQASKGVGQVMGLSGEEAVQEWVVFTFIYSLLYYIYQKSILIAIREPFQEYFLDISACFRFACACHYYSYLRFWRGYQIAIPFFALECSINSYLSEGGLDDPIDNIPIIMNGDFQGFFRIIFQVVGCALASWFSQLLWKMKYGKAFVTTDPTFLATIYNSNNNVGAFMCNSQTALSFALNSFSLEFFGTILRVVLADLRHRHIKLRNKLFVAFFNFAIILQGAGNKGYVLNPLYLVTSTFFCPHFSLLNSLRFYTASLLGSICASTLLIQARKWYNRIPSRLVSATCGSLSSSTSSLSPINSNILFPNNVTNGLSKVSMALTKHFSKSMN